jgi:hypothetical protein
MLASGRDYNFSGAYFYRVDYQFPPPVWTYTIDTVRFGGQKS